MRNPKPWQTLLFFLWTCGIFAALFLPPPKTKILETPGLDKVVHVLLYGVFGGLAVPVMGWLSIPAGVILGVTTEWGQKFIPHRTADLRDLLADMIGLVIGVLVAFIIERRRKR
jgi:VanZ family protein